MYPDLNVTARIYNLANSEFCKVNLNTVAYEWSYDQFIQLETFVLFQEDRKYWLEKTREVDSPQDNGAL